MAKKKLSRDQRRKQKKRKRRHRPQPRGVPARYDKMIQRLQESGMVGDREIVYAPKQAEKTSQVLLDFIEPYKEFADTTEAMHRLITTALVAWNTALLPEAEQAGSLKQISKSFPADTVDDFYAIVGEMIERKNRFFADHTRNILDYELTDKRDSYHVSVISTLNP